MILCWSEGQASSIHDHPSQHCIMKVSTSLHHRQIRERYGTRREHDCIQRKGETVGSDCGSRLESVYSVMQWMEKRRETREELNRFHATITRIPSNSHFLPHFSMSHLESQILSGTLTEARFAWPAGHKSADSSSGSKAGSSTSSEEDSEETAEGMKLLSETDLHVNDVAYMSGECLLVSSRTSGSSPTTRLKIRRLVTGI